MIGVCGSGGHWWGYSAVWSPNAASNPLGLVYLEIMLGEGGHVARTAEETEEHATAEPAGKEIGEEIAKDHLEADPQYYKK